MLLRMLKLVILISFLLLRTVLTSPLKVELDPIVVGTEITATQTIYVFTAGEGSCEDAENSFTVTINDTPVADAPENVEACDSYTFLLLTMVLTLPLKVELIQSRLELRSLLLKQSMFTLKVKVLVKLLKILSL
jgi:hypothetical protein